MTVKIVFIDCEHHAHHSARRLLGFLVIFFECVFQMTELALHSERRRHELHGGHHLVSWKSLEYLDALIKLLRGRANWGTCRGWRGLVPHPRPTPPDNR